MKSVDGSSNDGAGGRIQTDVLNGCVQEDKGILRFVHHVGLLLCLSRLVERLSLKSVGEGMNVEAFGLLHAPVFEPWSLL